MCETCFHTHQVTAGRHIKLPLLGEHVTGPVMETVEALMEGLEEAVTAQKEAAAGLNELIRQIHAYKLDLIRRTSADIRQLQSTIISAIHDLLESLTQNSPMREDLQTLLSLPVREKASKLQFATLIKNTDKEFLRTVEKRINLVITKRLSLLPLPETPVTYIPLLDPRQIYLSPAPFTMSYKAEIADFPDFLDFTAWCFLPNENLLVTGTRIQQHVLSVDCAGGVAFPLAETKVEHWLGGITRVAARVYLFGGIKFTDSTACEFFDLYENSWYLLPDMLSARSGFQPCVYNHYIYLIGGRHTQAAERFDLHQSTFQSIEIELPDSNFTVVFCDKDLFFLFIGREVYTWDQASEPRQLNQDLGLVFYSPMCPVRIGKDLYFQAREGDKENICLMRFDLEGLSLTAALRYGANS